MRQHLYSFRNYTSLTRHSSDDNRGSQHVGKQVSVIREQRYLLLRRRDGQLMWLLGYILNFYRN